MNGACKKLINTKKGTKVENPFTGKMVTVGLAAHKRALEKCKEDKGSKKKQKTTQKKKTSKTKTTEKGVKPPAPYGFSLGKFPNYLIYLYYLLKKYRKACTIPFTSLNSIKANKKNRFSNFKAGEFSAVMVEYLSDPQESYVTLKERLYEHTDFFVDSMRLCQSCDRPFFVAAVRILMRNAGGSAHLNLLFFDLENGEVERFEPHGPHTGWKPTGKVSAFRQENSDAFDGAMTKWVKHLSERMTTVTGKPYPMKYYPPDLVCPTFGLQNLEGKEAKTAGIRGGNCQTWALYYGELRLRYAGQLTREGVAAKALENVKEYGAGFRRFIDNERSRMEKIVFDLFKELKLKPKSSANEGVSKKALLGILDSYAGVIYDTGDETCRTHPHMKEIRMKE